MGSWVAVLVKLIYKKPLILRCGYNLYEFTKNNKSKYGIQIFSYLVMYISMKFASRIHVATSEDSLNIQKKFKQKKENIYIYPNWIDTRLFYSFTEDKPCRILFVGRLTYQKNVILLIKALENTNYELDIVGVGEELENIKEESRARNVKINFLGKIQNNKLPEIYNSHAIYVICSHYEGNPKTLLEAMACGCAVIGTNVNGISTIIKNNINGLLVQNDHLQLQESIKLLYNSYNHRLLLSTNAQKDINKDYSLTQILKKEINAYYTVEYKKK